MNKYISSLRLRTLPLSLSSIILGSCWSQSLDSINWIVFALAILTTVFLQILSNLANELGDFKNGADDDSRLGPKYALQSGALSTRDLSVMLSVFGVFALASGLALIIISFETICSFEFLAFATLGAAAVVAAVRYTLGKNPYGYRGLGDLFVFIFFGLVGVMGSYFLQHYTFSYEIALLAVASGCLAVAVLNVNNMRDVVSDRAAGKFSLVVKIGLKRARFYHIALISTSLIALVIADGIINLIFLPLFAYHIYCLFRFEGQQLDSQLPLLTISSLALSLFIVLF